MFTDNGTTILRFRTGKIPRAALPGAGVKHSKETQKAHCHFLLDVRHLFLNFKPCFQIFPIKSKDILMFFCYTQLAPCWHRALLFGTEKYGALSSHCRVIERGHCVLGEWQIIHKIFVCVLWMETSNAGRQPKLAFVKVKRARCFASVYLWDPKTKRLISRNWTSWWQASSTANFCFSNRVHTLAILGSEWHHEGHVQHFQIFELRPVLRFCVERHQPPSTPTLWVFDWGFSFWASLWNTINQVQRDDVEDFEWACGLRV